MAACICSPTACEFRSVIRFLNMQNIALIEIHRQVCQVYGPEIMSKQMKRHWCRLFALKVVKVFIMKSMVGRSSLINDDLIELVWQHIVENRQFTITELSNHFPQISQSLVHGIVTKHLLFKKLCAR
ncbi:hypothetical protein C0J52_11116 [Blattella germanica]|nr:hypothetical protein C0J52_11116 [Blattella germanica]